MSLTAPATFFSRFTLIAVTPLERLLPVQCQCHKQVSVPPRPQVSAPPAGVSATSRCQCHQQVSVPPAMTMTTIPDCLHRIVCTLSYQCFFCKFSKTFELCLQDSRGSERRCLVKEGSKYRDTVPLKTTERMHTLWVGREAHWQQTQELMLKQTHRLRF